MVIVDKVKSADINAKVLEAFVHNYMLMNDIEEDLTRQGHTDLFNEMIKLQQDGGVQIAVTEKLEGRGITLEGADDTSDDESRLVYGIDDEAPAPGEQTAALYEAYVPVTQARLIKLLPEIEQKIDGLALQMAFRAAVEELCLDYSLPAQPVTGIGPKLSL